tara:strand:+ start:76 stop:192 length:117 start_codon:yes stop_codon:yes gene_type:complete
MVDLFKVIIQRKTKKVEYLLEQDDDPNSVIDASELRRK